MLSMIFIMAIVIVGIIGMIFMFWMQKHNIIYWSDIIKVLNKEPLPKRTYCCRTCGRVFDNK